MTPPQFEPGFELGTFAGREGQAFQATSESPPVTLDLVLSSVAAWGPVATDGGSRRFTIVLRGPLEPILPQHIYHFEHDELGAFDMFIVPVGPDGATMQYEAVFG